MKRRTLLQTLPLFTLAPRTLYAGPTDIPKRFLLFYTHHGLYRPAWMMSGDSDRVWEANLSDGLSDIFSPLSAYTDRMMVVDGLSLLSAEDDVDGLRHAIGQIHSTTGAATQLVGGAFTSTAPSIDQLIAQAVADSGQYPSLELAVGVPLSKISFRAPGAQNPPETSPKRLFERLFSSSDRTFTKVPQQRSLLQAVQRRYEREGSRMVEQSRLETHASLLSALGSRLEGLEARLAQCSTPASPSGSQAYETVFQSFVSLLSTAFTCDLTRVISLNMCDIPATVFDPDEFGDIHFEHAHNIYSSEKAAELMYLYGRRHAQHLAWLASVLDEIPEPFGGTGSLLDNTMIVWISEMGDGTHCWERWPAVVLGGNAFSSLPYGRYMHYPSTIPYRAWSWSGMLDSVALPHQRFLRSIVRQFGVDPTRIQAPKIVGSDGLPIDTETLLF
ncbi:MAG: DUF1552 domain-containing protein [Myxococcota bacterium]|nr:DUF1552 domain-containing protein [Myxococcota bacterium]